MMNKIAPKILPSKPVVISYPRSGFSLFINIVRCIMETGHQKHNPSVQRVCQAASGDLGLVMQRVVKHFKRENDFVFNGDFQIIVGGPKWMNSEGTHLIVRKYFGVNGLGDFTVNFKIHKYANEYYSIKHSHSGAGQWLHSESSSGTPFIASVRDPLDAVMSACFSINALTSEYIQKSLNHVDQNTIRTQLALYKLSDLNFFQALLEPLVKFYTTEWEGLTRFSVFKWETLVDRPIDTIVRVAESLGRSISQAEASRIWESISHKNLTGYHKHNYRPGFGIPYGYRKILTKHHFDLAETYGLGRVYDMLGYDLTAPKINEYTDFQKKLSDSIESNEIIREYQDSNLFLYAFNKSNIDFKRFPFTMYDWNINTQLERSMCSDKDEFALAMASACEEAVGRYNSAFAELEKSHALGREADLRSLCDFVSPTGARFS